MKRLVLLFVLLSLCAAPLWAATVTEVQQSGTQDTWHNGAATLASNAQVLSAAVTLTNPGHRHAWCTLNIPSTSVAVAANTAVLVWFRVSTDGGTTYPDGDASTTPASPPDMTFPLRAVSTAQVVATYVETMPLGSFKVLIRNDSTGATINTTWSLKCRTHTEQIN